MRMLLSRGIECFWESMPIITGKLGQAQSGNFNSFLYIIAGGLASESAGLPQGRARFAFFVCLFVQGINCKCFPQRILVYTRTILTQKENWIWIAAFVTSRVDAKVIPKSTEAKGCTVTHPYTFITDHRVCLSQLPLFSITLFPKWERSCLESQVPTDPIPQFLSLEPCSVKLRHDSGNSQRGSSSLTPAFPTRLHRLVHFKCSTAIISM